MEVLNIYYIYNYYIIWYHKLRCKQRYHRRKLRSLDFNLCGDTYGFTMRLS